MRRSQSCVLVSWLAMKLHRIWQELRGHAPNFEAWELRERLLGAFQVVCFKCAVQLVRGVRQATRSKPVGCYATDHPLGNRSGMTPDSLLDRLRSDRARDERLAAQSWGRTDCGRGHVAQRLQWIENINVNRYLRVWLFFTERLRSSFDPGNSDSVHAPLDRSSWETTLRREAQIAAPTFMFTSSRLL
jgi:hypothetical protein